MSNNTASQNRIFYLDMLRIVAILLVVFQHSTLFFDFHQSNKIAISILILLNSSATGLFFMISGALLLPLKSDAAHFLKRRVKVIVVPLLTWSVIYLINSYLHTGYVSPQIIISSPFYPVEDFLWFPYAILLIYLLMPIISVCLKASGKRMIQYYLALWGLSSIVTYQHGLLLGLEAPSNMFSPLYNNVGYVVLGYYLHHWPLRFSSQGKLATVISMGSLFIAAVFYFEEFLQPRWGVEAQTTYLAVNNEMSVNTMLLAIFYFSIFQHFFSKKEHIPHESRFLAAAVTTLSVCSYGIYFIHKLIGQNAGVPIVSELLPSTSHWIQAVLWGGITFTLSFLIIFLLRFTPFSFMLTGRRRIHLNL